MFPFQNFNHILIFAQKAESCSRLLKLEVTPNAKNCSKVAKHNLSGPTNNHLVLQLGFICFSPEVKNLFYEPK